MKLFPITRASGVTTIPKSKSTATYVADKFVAQKLSEPVWQPAPDSLPTPGATPTPGEPNPGVCPFR